MNLIAKRTPEQKKSDIRRAILIFVFYVVTAVLAYGFAAYLGAQPQAKDNQFLVLLITAVAVWCAVLAIIDLVVTLVLGRNPLISGLVTILLVAAFFKWFV